jgi:hypothetical protein
MAAVAPELFYESWEEALRDDVRALGGAKAVASLLWPEKSDPIAARNKLNDALNPERRDRLSHEQEMLIMRKAKEVRGWSAGIFYLCDEAGFDRPQPKDPQDEQAKRQREFINAVKVLERLAPQLMQQTTQPLQAVRSA